MEAFFLFILFVFGFTIFFVGIIFLIAYLASQSRKRKQEVLLKEMPENDFHAFVRFNRGKQQDKILKVVGFQGSGVIYVKDNLLHFKDTLGQNSHTFDLKNSNIFWENINIVNGALRWFSVHDETESFYFNIESGMFIWHMGKGLKTKDVYERLLEFKAKA